MSERCDCPTAWEGQGNFLCRKKRGILYVWLLKLISSSCKPVIKESLDFKPLPLRGAKWEGASSLLRLPYWQQGLRSKVNWCLRTARSLEIRNPHFFLRCSTCCAPNTPQYPGFPRKSALGLSVSLSSCIGL